MLNYDWYKTLIQPPLAPPGWIFAPVWTILYISMLVALFFYAQTQTTKDKSWGCTIFFLQLIVNLIWSPIFFGLQNIAFALAVIIVLDIMVLLNIIEFYKISKKAGLILVPYFIWIIFATYLNLGYFILNNSLIKYLDSPFRTLFKSNFSAIFNPA